MLYALAVVAGAVYTIATGDFMTAWIMTMTAWACIWCLKSEKVGK